jgi:hypothetical protein
LKVFYTLRDPSVGDLGHTPLQLEDTSPSTPSKKYVGQSTTRRRPGTDNFGTVRRGRRVGLVLIGSLGGDGTGKVGYRCSPNWNCMIRFWLTRSLLHCLNIVLLTERAVLGMGSTWHEHLFEY